MIDTASNYGNGLAKVAVGTALRTMAAIGAVDRDDIVIVSKAGYLPTEDPRHQGHTIHPAFLCQSIAASRRRMGSGDHRRLSAAQPGGATGFRPVGLDDPAGCVRRLGNGRRPRARSAATAFPPRKGSWPRNPAFIHCNGCWGSPGMIGGPDRHFRVIELPVSLWRREAFMATPYLVEISTRPARWSWPQRRDCGFSASQPLGRTP